MQAQHVLQRVAQRFTSASGQLESMKRGPFQSLGGSCHGSDKMGYILRTFDPAVEWRMIVTGGCWRSLPTSVPFCEQNKPW